MTDKETGLVGKKVIFNYQRIRKANPVKGTVISENEEWIELILDHGIWGMNDYWYKGEEKMFRKVLINGEIQEIK